MSEKKYYFLALIEKMAVSLGLDVRRVLVTVML